MKIRGNRLPKIKSLLIILISVFVVSYAFAQSSRDQNTDINNYANEFREDPADYLISKFKNHDIVLISEFNHFGLHTDLLESIIPDLQYHGIYILAIECGDEKFQKTLDKLITSNYFDEETASKILAMSKVNNQSYRKDFIKIFKEAWRVNRLTYDNGKKFSILLLNTSGDLALDRTRFAPSIFYKKIISKGKKALIYSTAIHSPNSKCELTSFLKHSFPLVLKPGSKEAFSINFHSPWIITKSSEQNKISYKKPMNGIIDDFINRIGNKPVGFDTKGSPFQDLVVDPFYYNNNNSGCKLTEICDGYLFIATHDQFKSFTDNPINKGY